MRRSMWLLQMNSPDPRCGYCKGADQLFDQAAALPHKPALAFARVQWTPWRQMPDFGKLIHVAASYRQALDTWRTTNDAALKQSTLLMISRTSREDAKAMGPLVEQEKKTLQAWQTGKLGISMRTAPAIADCDKLFASLASLP